MRSRIPKINCGCSSKTSRAVRNGVFFRKSDSRTIERFRCSKCRKSFSRATLNRCFNQNKRKVNLPLMRHLCSGVSMRRCAKLLGIHRTTVARKKKWLAEQCRLSQKKHLGQFDLTHLQFDEMETFEHTKYKPLSIALVVTKQRKIVSFQVASMPAKGHLAKTARKRYGFRKDGRPAAFRKLFTDLKQHVPKFALFESDQNPTYPFYVRTHFPGSQHIAHKGKRGCVVGQGELKNVQFDPLFALNHTAAMLRANMSRLFRRTWNTTKKAWALRDHIDIYVHYHNTVLCPDLTQ